MRGRSLTELSDAELFSELKRLVAIERESTVDVLRHLAEVDRRRVVGYTGAPSLFVYCVRVLGYSEGAAYRRIHAARCAREFPRVYVLLRRGRISLTTVSLLAPHICRENYRSLLERACGMTRYEVERLVAELAPRREPRETIRPLGAPPAPPASDSTEGTLPMLGAMPETPPAQVDGGSAPSAASEAVAPEAPRRVEFRFSAGEAFLAKVRRARQVLSHKHPYGRLEDILDEAVEALLDKRDPDRRIARLEKRRAAKTAPVRVTSATG
ncbi:hypothetical protein EPO15_04745 [bacterium]|nr:MAG: hypothetical protein EPO15_04745 [bacterium]